MVEIFGGLNKTYGLHFNALVKSETELCLELSLVVLHWDEDLHMF